MDGLRDDGDDDKEHQPHPCDSASVSSRSSNDDLSIKSITNVSDDDDRDGSLSPPPLSSPSIASSLGLSASFLNPFPDDHSRSTLHDGDGPDEMPTIGRHVLAKRLARLVQQLADGEDVDDEALSDHIDRMENAFTKTQAPLKSQHRQLLSPQLRDYQNTLGSSLGSSASRSRFPDLPLSRTKSPETEDDEERPPPRKGMTAKQATMVIKEVTKLNDQLGTVVSNLTARQEESDHIHSLLIERAERAAQRIIFLQNRISYLEDELRENDDELQHLRISLKAVEVQMPPHPDKELQRCISTFKDDYQELRKKRAGRASLASLESSLVGGSSLTGDSPSRL